MIENIAIELTSIVIDNTAFLNGILITPFLVRFKIDEIKENLLIHLSFDDSSITFENLGNNVEILMKKLTGIALNQVAFVCKQVRETTFAYLMLLRLQKLGIVCNVFYEKENAMRWLRCQ
ncbi:hypothetical protein [Carboxylicivirga linearis]|uniref:STAS/SEC14 domain-containing protein n=1 Tax=Carboxylicivirga linearis TaxID=1628157 RepID=A0ABS5JZP5_9BACT|nr:hypothetical protein [Carboxylicivirga linearis]MBS2100377.1 hypothetical protein [Carboxylicivirga linearis]